MNVPPRELPQQSEMWRTVRCALTSWGMTFRLCMIIAVLTGIWWLR